MSSEIAGRYSQAVFEIAQENGTIEELKEQAKVIQKVLEENPILHEFFRAVKITKEKKKKMIDECFSSLDRNVVNFLKLLVDKDRMYYLNEMLEEIITMCNKALGIELAVVYSVRPLPKEDLNRIQEALQKQRGGKILIENKIDKTLIAGIKVVVGSTVTDVSMANSIETMKKQLLKKGDVL